MPHRIIYECVSVSFLVVLYDDLLETPRFYDASNLIRTTKDRPQDMPDESMRDVVQWREYLNLILKNHTFINWLLLIFFFAFLKLLY